MITLHTRLILFILLMYMKFMVTYVIYELMWSVVISLKIAISSTGDDDSSVVTIFTSGFRQRVSDVLYCFVLIYFDLKKNRIPHFLGTVWTLYFSSEAIEIVLFSETTGHTTRNNYKLMDYTVELQPIC